MRADIAWLLSQPSCFSVQLFLLQKTIYFTGFLRRNSACNRKGQSCGRNNSPGLNCVLDCMCRGTPLTLKQSIRCMGIQGQNLAFSTETHAGKGRQFVAAVPQIVLFHCYMRQTRASPSLCIVHERDSTKSQVCCLFEQQPVLY